MKRHGFTLAELVIVIALSTVVLLAITAMMLSISGYSHARSAELDAKREISLLEDRLTWWFSSFDSADTQAPEVSESGRSLYFSTAGEGEESGKTFSVLFNPDTHVLTVDERSGGELTLSCSHLSDVTFSKSASSEADQGLVRCTVTYSVSGDTRSYTFLLLKRSVNAE